MTHPTNSFWTGVAAAAVIATVGYALDYMVGKHAVKTALREHDAEKHEHTRSATAHKKRARTAAAINPSQLPR